MSWRWRSDGNDDDDGDKRQSDDDDDGVWARLDRWDCTIETIDFVAACRSCRWASMFAAMELTALCRAAGDLRWRRASSLCMMDMMWLALESSIRWTCCSRCYWRH